MNVLLVILITIYLPIAVTSGGNVGGSSATVTVRPNTSTVYNNVGGHTILGEIHNGTGVTVGLLRVTATTPAGQSADTMVQVGRLSPGETGCFAIRTQSPTPWLDAALSVTYMDASSDKPTGLTVEEQHDGFDATGQYVVTGSIRNTSSVTVTAVYAVVTLYDATGRVIGCNGASALRLLQPGDTSSPRLLPPGTVGDFRNVSPFAVSDVARYTIGLTAEVARR